MVTKKELTSLAKKALSNEARVVELENIAETSAYDDVCTLAVSGFSTRNRSALLAAALRGIISWKDAKK